jgi:hypothetical protein
MGTVAGGEMLKCKVFSATKSVDRQNLGEVVTDWIHKTNPTVEDKQVLQSSDSEYHCLSIVIFYR